MCARPRLLRREQPPHRRLHPENFKEVPDHLHPCGRLRLSAPRQPIIVRARERLIPRHVLIRPRLRLELLIRIGRVRRARQSAFLRRRSNPHQLLRFRKRQRPQQNRIHHAEYRDVRPNPQRQYQYRHHGEAQIPPQRPHRVPQILPQHIHKRQPPSRTLYFARLLHPAKTHHSLPPRLFQRHPTLQILLNRKLQMRSHLRIQIRIQRCPSKKRPHPIHPLPQRIAAHRNRLPALISVLFLNAERRTLVYSLFPIPYSLYSAPVSSPPTTAPSTQRLPPTASSPAS